MVWEMERRYIRRVLGGKRSVALCVIVESMLTGMARLVKRLKCRMRKGMMGKDSQRKKQLRNSYGTAPDDEEKQTRGKPPCLKAPAVQVRGAGRLK